MNMSSARRLSPTWVRVRVRVRVGAKVRVRDMVRDRVRVKDTLKAYLQLPYPSES